MKSNANKPSVILNPGEKLSPEIIEQLKIGDKQIPFQEYLSKIQNLFGLSSIECSETLCWFLGGFLEGEGSFSVSVKKNKNSTFGVQISPGFNATQHVNGVCHLVFLLQYFQTGRIRYKKGSLATMVFIIEARDSLIQRVCPFAEKYVYPFSSNYKKKRYDLFKKLLMLLSNNAHLDRDRLINEILPIWSELRVQKGYEGETFKTLEEAQEYVRNYKKS